MIVNAAHAISDSIARSDAARELLGIATRRRAEWLEVIIADNGAGIADDIITKVFDPLYTTKEVGKWSGQDKDKEQ